MEARDADLMRHPARKQYVRFLVLGLLLAGIGALTMVTGTLSGLPFVILGPLVALLGWWGMSVLPANRLLNAAYAEIAQRRFVEAERLLDRAEAISRARLVRGVSQRHRALIALRRGDLQHALVFIEASLVKPVGRFGASFGLRAAEAYGKSLRAF